MKQRYRTFIQEYPDNADSKALNERITEDIVRDIFKKNRQSYPDVSIHEQKTTNPRIEKLLKQASKQGSGGGKPEFIVTFNNEKDLVMIVECKADIKKHESKGRGNYKDYAVDGVLLYSSYLSKEFDVIAIAVSGEKKTQLKISHFLQLRNQQYKEVQTNEILSFEDYVKLYKKDPEKEKKDLAALMRYSKKLHNDLRDFAKLSEPEKPMLVGAILIALTDESFVSSYPKKKKPVNLAKLLLNTVKEVLENAKMPDAKIQSMLHPYSFIQVHPELTKDEEKGKPINLLYDLIKDIEDNVRPFAGQHPDFDILGQFYGEFLRYAGGDKKGLGIVLTPKHVTELFVELADVKKNDVAFDNCCGTGGFLISAMKRMMLDAGNDSSIIKQIREKQLIGIEQQPNMFALACANMILRGDGKANLYRDNCFSLTETIKRDHTCTVGFLNPPYSQKGDGLSELDFVENCLECLQKDCLCFAIVPLNCATAPSSQKERLLKKHTLEAVISLPNDLFQGVVGVITCAMVFKAHKPHNSARDTWFGYWKDDGFVKTKYEGRIDKFGRWPAIKAKWVDNFINRRDAIGESVLHSVKADDEWCAEAYMKTDYSAITEDDFKQGLNDYVVFNIMNDLKAMGSTSMFNVETEEEETEN